MTTFMALLAVYAALLHRLTGEEKLLVSSQNANRGRPEVQGLLGFFLTQLVLAADLAENPTYRELLKRVRATAIRAFGHQDLPFGKLVEAVRPERDPSRAPLVQVSLQVLDAEYAQFELPGLTAESVKLDEEAALFDLSLTLWESSRGITGTLEHNLDLFDATTGLRLARAFESLIAQVGRDPEVRLSELRLLGDGAVHQVLAEWNDTAVAEPAPRVDHLVAEQAARTPDAVALATPDGEVTYRELVSRAAQLAAWLQSQGIGPEARVGLCVERTAEIAVGMLGIWQAGAAWVPLDPGYPADRLAFILEDAGLAAVVTRDGLASHLPVSSPALLSLDRLEQAPPSPGGVGGDGRGGQGGEGQLAYVIYTSGTTGRPKGVMVEHGNLAHVLRASRREFGWSERDRIPALAPFSFDIFLFELWSPLTAGGTCELIPLAPALDLPALMAALERSTRLHAVPALMRQIVALGRAEGKRWPGVRTLFVGGDAVPPELLADLPDVFPSAEIRVLYGPTEGTIICASFRANDIPWPDRGPKAMLGRPLPDAEIRLVDRSGGLAAIGVPGELWIGGPGVTRGYLGREELTAEKYPQVDGRRWYRTGDLARWLPDGLLEFLGRADDQVKVRGFRIEPGEIESALVEHPAVREAVVLAVPLQGIEGGDKRLVAWVVPEGGEGAWEEAEDAVRAALARRLPEHMVP
ncbi:MAG TPA: amino acid adenylation domain-containing protein, partial [Thermoanaerobaculia bacterium]|nr:amino acid adenylation domain-containing protein [Thermoanaerobaculia bacterium]